MASAVTLRTPDEIRIMQDSNQIVANTLQLLKSRIEPGVSTFQLDSWAEEYARKKGGTPAFKGYRGFPGSLCVSINQQVVHGIPSKKVVLREGDIVSIDFGVKYKGYYGDSAITVAVGNIKKQTQELLNVTKISLEKAIEQVVPGNRVTHISCAVQDYVESHSFAVVRQFVGHGIGSELHEPPEVPNYKRNERTQRLLPGMVLAIEPMVNLGTHEVKILSDGWTVVTADGKPSAHFEHSVAVTEGDPLVLSAWL